MERGRFELVDVLVATDEAAQCRVAGRGAPAPPRPSWANGTERLLISLGGRGQTSGGERGAPAMADSERFENPMAEKDSPSPSPDVDGEEMSAAQMIAANESEMTEEQLSDLTYAFTAADMDGGGAIDVEEFGMMLSVRPPRPA